MILSKKSFDAWEADKSVPKPDLKQWDITFVINNPKKVGKIPKGLGRREKNDGKKKTDRPDSGGNRRDKKE